MKNEKEIPGSFHSPGSLPEVHFHLWNSLQTKNEIQFEKTDKASCFLEKMNWTNCTQKT